MTKETRTEILRARRAVNNFRAMVRRSSNWTGALENGYATAYAALVIAEDSHGIDAIAGLDDRLTTLRREAGLSPAEIIRAEREAMERANAERERRMSRVQRVELERDRDDLRNLH